MRSCASLSTTTTTWRRATGCPTNIDWMREHDLLYDRDERGGEFFHAYTENSTGDFSWKWSSGAVDTTATARRTRRCGSRRMRVGAGAGR